MSSVPFLRAVHAPRDSVWTEKPEPDVWWGEGGIDAPIWPKPYGERLPKQRQLPQRDDAV